MIFSYLLLLLFCAIYIPLCLYFNPFPLLFHSSLFSFTFHYVSILIDNVNYHTSCEHIYIPLCLYFNEEGDIIYKFPIYIYIPLCLYFNRVIAVPIRYPPVFTFHYVSILIDFHFPSICSSSLFTFHYVSILMIKKKK